MRSETSALDLFFIVKELQLLKDGKLEKVFHNKKKKEEIVFRIYANQHKTQILRVSIPKYIYLSQYKSEFEQPSGFAMFLRRHLKNARIKSIEQKDFDRILVLEFEIKKERLFETKYLIIELFSTGNIVLTDSSFKIIAILNSIRKKDRIMIPGKNYSFPVKKINPLSDEMSLIKDKIKTSDKESIIKSLAIDLGFGGEYAEFICKKAIIDKNKKINEISDIEIEKILECLNLLNNIVPKGYVYECSINPFELIDKKIISKNDTFCQAIDETITESKFSEEKILCQNKSDKKIDRIDNVLKKQEEMLKKILSNYKENNEKGEILYNNYQEVQALLKEINELKKDNKSWDEIKSILKNNKLKPEINEKNNELIINVIEEKELV